MSPLAFGASALPRLIDDEVRTGCLRILLRPVVARGLASERAARLAYAAELQDRMWPFVMALLATQHAGRDAALDDARLRGVAVSVPGLDVARAMAAARGDTTSAALRQAQRRALARGVATTPGFLLGPTGGSMRHQVPRPEHRRPVDGLRRRTVSAPLSRTAGRRWRRRVR
jgi:predicted DsbA family dithiol-disulfide isomerase